MLGQMHLHCVEYSYVFQPLIGPSTGSKEFEVSFVVFIKKPGHVSSSHENRTTEPGLSLHIDRFMILLPHENVCFPASCVGPFVSL